jgi:site-specific DNA-methyltransferase (adenine-specific)
VASPVVIGNATLYLGDCLEILPTLPKVDAVITDPPYGIGTGDAKCGGSKSKDWGHQGWDAEPAQAAIELTLNRAEVCIVWGGNYYVLPPSRCWLSWDKCQPDAWYSTAHFELAWTNMDRNARTWRMSQVQAYASMGKEHPSQKPLALMVWCIEQAGKPQTTLDPFMGSGTTGVAAMQMGLGFIGIEREPKYFDIACRRIEQAQAQGKLFEPEQVKAEQLEL